jgi:hypothetical protein
MISLKISKKITDQNPEKKLQGLKFSPKKTFKKEITEKRVLLIYIQQFQALLYI